MWKVGDKIRCIKFGVLDTLPDFGFKIDNIYTIKSVEKIHYSSTQYLDQEGYKYLINGDRLGLNGRSYGNWWIEPSCFELIVKLPIKNESEFLDRLKENEDNYYG